MTDIGLMVRSANPVLDESQALTNDELSAVLLLAQQRSGGMDTKQAPPVVVPEKKNRNGWLVAAAAFALVLVVVGASLLFADDGETPTATTPPTTAAVTPTTEAAPPTTVAATVDAIEAGPSEQVRQEAVNALLGLATSGDVDELAVLLEGAEARFGFHRGGLAGTSDAELVERQLALERAMGTQFEVDECAFGESQTRIECSVLANEAVRDALGLTGLPMLLKADIDTSGQLTWLFWEWDISATQYMDAGGWESDLDAFVTWLEGNHPEDLATMIPQTGKFAEPSTSPESVALWDKHVQAFLETLDTNDGADLTPEIAAIVDGMEAAHVSGDSAAFRALHHPEFVRVNDSGSSVPLDLVVTEMESIYAMGSLIDWHDCALLEGGFRCSYSVSGPVEDAIYAGEPFTSSLRYWVDDDGLISRIELERIGGWGAYFTAWLQVAHPDEFAVVDARHPHLYVANDWPIWVEYAPIWAEAGRPIVTP